MARCSGLTFAIEEQASRAITNQIARPGNDGFHEEKTFRCLIAALDLIAPCNFGNREGSNLCQSAWKNTPLIRGIGVETWLLRNFGAGTV